MILVLKTYHSRYFHCYVLQKMNRLECPSMKTNGKMFGSLTHDIGVVARHKYAPVFLLIHWFKDRISSLDFKLCSIGWLSNFSVNHSSFYSCFQGYNTLFRFVIFAPNVASYKTHLREFLQARWTRIILAGAFLFAWPLFFNMMPSFYEPILLIV